jgi:hypothetical protein
MFGASGGAFTGRVKAAWEPSSVRFVTPWNGWDGRGKTVLSQSVIAAEARVICDASANAITITYMISLEMMRVGEVLRAYTRCW